MIERLKAKYQEMADLTRPKCGSCTVPLSCCSPEYCELAINYAAESGIELKPTGHPKLPLMGPTGCTAEPYLRPLCAVHVCERHYASDLSFANTYFTLRAEIDDLEFQQWQQNRQKN